MNILKTGPFTYCLLLLLTLLSACSSLETSDHLHRPRTRAGASPKIVIPGFEEPLMAVSTGADVPLSRPTLKPGSTALERLQAYLALNRNSVWEASIQLNLGLADYRRGYFKQTFKAFSRAFELSRDDVRPAPPCPGGPRFW